MVAGVVGGLAELVDHTLRGRIGGIPHAHVDHIISSPPLLVGELVDPRDEIGGQTRDPIGHAKLAGPLHLLRTVGSLRRIGSGIGIGRLRSVIHIWNSKGE